MTLNKAFCLEVMECGAFGSEDGEMGCDHCQISEDPLDIMDIEDCTHIKVMIEEAKNETQKALICKNAARCPLEFPPARDEVKKAGMVAVRLYIEDSTQGHCQNCGGTIFYPHKLWSNEHVCVSCGQNADIIGDPLTSHTIREERV